MPIDYSKFDGVGDTDSEEEAKDEPRFTAGDADELIRGLATRSMAEKMNAMTPLPKSDAAIEEAKRRRREAEKRKKRPQRPVMVF